MTETAINSSLKKSNIELIVFVDSRPKLKHFLKVDDLKHFLEKQSKAWETVKETLPSYGVVEQSYEMIASKVSQILDAETIDTETLKKFAAELSRDTYARPLLTFERNPLPNFARTGIYPTEWVGIILQKLAIPDNYNILSYDQRITELYFSVIAQISVDNIEQSTVLEQSLEWNKQFRDSVSTFIQKQEEELAALEANRQQNFNVGAVDHENRFAELVASHESKLSSIEKTYEEKVRIAEPANLWETKRKKYSNQGRTWFIVSLCIALGICAIGFLFFLFFPEVVKNKDTGGFDYTGSVRWLLLVGSGIGALIFLLRQSVKITLSGYHMSRDAEEKAALTSFYLSLIANKSLDPEKEIELRTIIMNALFARVDTGLLRGDNSPTLPGAGLTEVAKLAGGKT